MRFPPPEVLATWPKPNYVNPISQGPAMLIVQLTILPMALIVLAVRFYVRIFMLRRSWWDDWTMLAAAFFGTGVTICAVLAAQRYGWAIHVWDLTPVQAVKGRQASLAVQTLFVFASGLSKSSILLSYLRIAPMGSYFRRITYAMLAICLIIIGVFVIVLWTECRPISDYWELRASHRNCIDEGVVLMSNAIITIITDFIVYLIPMPAFYKLKLPSSQRIGLIILFGVGGVVVIAAIMRVYYIYNTVYETYDVTWVGYNLMIWTAIEVNLGVICGSVPSLKPLLFRSRPRDSHYVPPYEMFSNITSDRRRMTHRSQRDEEMDTLTEGITVKHDVAIESSRKVPSCEETRVQHNRAEWSSVSSIDNHVAARDRQPPGQGRS